MQAWTIVRKPAAPDPVPLEHHMFGMMLGKMANRLKSRAGGTRKPPTCWTKRWSAHAVWWRRKPGDARR